jgi:hypothetical protein
MKIAAEIDSKGQPLRIFHRTPTAAWTHAPGERYRYRGGRHGAGWVEMACPCPTVASSNADARGRAPGPTAATLDGAGSGGGRG